MMAELEINLELGDAFRKGMISSLADIIDAMPQYRYAVILELLTRDALSRTMIAEAIGEAGIRAHQEDFERVGRGGDAKEESWDDIAKRVLAELKDTPGGRAEV